MTATVGEKAGKRGVQLFLLLVHRQDLVLFECGCGKCPSECEPVPKCFSLDLGIPRQMESLVCIQTQRRLITLGYSVSAGVQMG